MKIQEAIARVDAIKPNTYEEIDKVRWLSELDGKIKAEIIDTHEGGTEVIFKPYDIETDIETTLIAPPPYDNLYILWLESKIDYNNSEFAKYNNSSVAFNNAYAEFQKYYNRTHMPKRHKLKFF